MKSGPEPTCPSTQQLIRLSGTFQSEMWQIDPVADAQCSRISPIVNQIFVGVTITGNLKIACLLIHREIVQIHRTGGGHCEPAPEQHIAIALYSKQHIPLAGGCLVQLDGLAVPEEGVGQPDLVSELGAHC